MKRLPHSLGEGAAIALGLAAFWPPILGYQGWWVQLGMITALVWLTGVAFLRVKRVRRALEEANGCACGPIPGPRAHEKE